MKFLSVVLYEVNAINILKFNSILTESTPPKQNEPANASLRELHGIRRKPVRVLQRILV
jgi:hypothetical protein